MRFRPDRRSQGRRVTLPRAGKIEARRGTGSRPAGERDAGEKHLHHKDANGRQRHEGADLFHMRAASQDQNKNPLGKSETMPRCRVSSRRLSGKQLAPDGRGQPPGEVGYRATLKRGGFPKRRAPRRPVRIRRQCCGESSNEFNFSLLCSLPRRESQPMAGARREATNKAFGEEHDD